MLANVGLAQTCEPQAKEIAHLVHTATRESIPTIDGPNNRREIFRDIFNLCVRTLKGHTECGMANSNFFKLPPKAHQQASIPKVRGFPKEEYSQWLEQLPDVRPPSRQKRKDLYLQL